jgi:hypothetical protein
MSWRRLRADELDHELLWLLVSCGALICALVWLGLGLPRPRCAFHQITGWACFGCGTTRCVQHLLAGSFGEALRMNPLAFAAIAAGALFNLYATVVLVLRLPRVRFDQLSVSQTRVLRFCAILAVALNWAWVLANGV